MNARTAVIILIIQHVDYKFIIIYNNDVHYDTLSKRLKKLRQNSGLSLSELSARVGTSPATLSKYETGWGRFEFYTLSKIAMALHCKLDIRFTPIEITNAPKGIKSCIGKIQRLFWEHKLTEGDFRRYPQWIMGRVLEYGSLEDVHSLINVMGRRMFLKQVAGLRLQSPKARCFWNTILKKEGVKCTKKSFRRGVWNF